MMGLTFIIQYISYYYLYTSCYYSDGVVVTRVGIIVY